MVGSAPDLGSLRETLARLDEVLQDRAPVIAGALRPGLTVQQVRGLIEDLPHECPESVGELYRWHDGTEIIKGPYRAELFPDGQMLPLAEALQLRAGAIEGSRDGGGQSAWHSSWLPVFTEGMERFRVVTCGMPGGHLLFFDYVNLPRTITEYQGLAAFMESLFRRWQAGAYRQGAYGTVEEDRQVVAEVYRAEDTQPVDIDRLIGDLAESPEDAYRDSLFLMRTRLYPAAVPGLIRLLARGSLRGRLAAAELLGDIGDPTATEPLRQMANHDPNELVRGIAVKSLEKLRGA